MPRPGKVKRAAAVAALALALFACSPMAPDVEPPTLAPFPTETNTPPPTATAVPSATAPRTATPQPTATRPPAPPTLPPTATAIGIAPVSKYVAPINGQATAQGAIFTLRRAEFWRELTLVKPRFALFTVLVGELAGVNNQAICVTADDFVLSLGDRRYGTSSTLMDPFKMLYKADYPGSLRGLCVTHAEPTFVVFDTALPAGTARLAFRRVNIDLGDLAGALRRSGYPLNSGRQSDAGRAVFAVASLMVGDGSRDKVTENLERVRWSVAVQSGP